MKIVKALGFAMAVVLSPWAAAQVYISGGVGLTSANETGMDDAVGARLGLGYRFNETFSAELNYFRSGDFQMDEQILLQLLADELDFSGLPDDVTIAGMDAQLDVDGYELALLAELPFNATWSGYARLGLFRYAINVAFDMDLRYSGQRDLISHSTEADSGTDASIGLGVRARFSDRLSGFVEASQYSAGEGDVSFYGLGLSLSF